jgi:hypothetical protein
MYLDFMDFFNELCDGSEVCYNELILCAEQQPEAFM